MLTGYLYFLPPKKPRNNALLLLWLLVGFKTVLASEICAVPFGRNNIKVYVKCPNYCCRDVNATLYCCSDCSLSVNSDSCSPELWRYVLYVGLGVAGVVAMGYMIFYLAKHYKEPMKRACCKQRTGRVQDPSAAMASDSVWTVSGSGQSNHLDFELTSRDQESFYSLPRPPAYTQAAEAQRETAATPPPVYTEGAQAEAAVAAAAVVAPHGDASMEELPPAYSEEQQIAANQTRI